MNNVSEWEQARPRDIFNPIENDINKGECEDAEPNEEEIRDSEIRGARKGKACADHKTGEPCDEWHLGG